MTIQEFSDSFDVLANSYANKAIFGDEASIRDFTFDEYEKSIWLTKAQEEIVLSLYSGRSGTGFEETEEVRRYLSKLVKEAYPEKITNSAGNPIGIGNSYYFSLPPDVWFITLEAVNTGSEDDACGTIGGMEVVPVTQDEYHKIKRNPFRGPNNRRALRLDLSEGSVQIICKYPVTRYYITYVRKPEPIILVDLAGTNLFVGESQNKSTKCELHEALHHRILDRAVLLALQSRGYTKTTKDSN